MLLNPSVDPVTGLVVLIFSSPGAALLMAGAILAAAIALIVLSGFFEYRPLVSSLLQRINALNQLGGRSLSAQQAFAQRFGDIDKTMGSSLTAPPPLVLGWSHWRGLLAQDDSGRLTTSARAAETFGRFDAPARSLEWWANIFVAIGLVVTFLGIVAALTEAVSTMQAGSSGAMQAALLSLLAIAATKFWTSIAGVFSSILLRMVARRWRDRIAHHEADFFATLDGLVIFSPPERVAQEQLAILRRIEITLGGRAPDAAAPAPAPAQ